MFRERNLVEARANLQWTPIWDPGGSSIDQIRPGSFYEVSMVGCEGLIWSVFRVGLNLACVCRLFQAEIVTDPEDEH